jgi:hypothetical protein
VEVVTDITDPAACDGLVVTSVDRHGGVDVLIHAPATSNGVAPAHVVLFVSSGARCC